MTNIKEIIGIECGLNSHIKTPCLETQKLYQLLTVNDDIDVHLVKASTNKNKDKRRQMASTSGIKLTRHTGAMAYSNFRPVTEKWIHPKNLGKGSIVLMMTIKYITGAHFKPIFPAFILNEDCSSQY